MKTISNDNTTELVSVPHIRLKQKQIPLEWLGPNIESPWENWGIRYLFADFLTYHLTISGLFIFPFVLDGFSTE